MIKVGDAYTKRGSKGNPDVTRTVTALEGMYVIYTTSYSFKKAPIRDLRLSLEAFSQWANRADNHENCTSTP